MLQNKIQMTIIHCEKLQNIVGLGETSPYQVTLSAGETLGAIGQIRKSASSIASNQPWPETSSTDCNSWVNRILGLFRSLKNRL